MTTSILERKPTRVVNFAKILPLFQPAGATTLELARRTPPDIHLARALRSRSDAPVLVRPQRPTAVPRLQRLAENVLSMPRVSGSISRAAGMADLEPSGTVELDLPFGMTRFVNSATLKRMLKAKRGDLLLRRVGEKWEVCEDSLRVDLLDDSVEFRLGPVQIFS